MKRIHIQSDESRKQLDRSRCQSSRLAVPAFLKQRKNSKFSDFHFGKWKYYFHSSDPFMKPCFYVRESIVCPFFVGPLVEDTACIGEDPQYGFTHFGALTLIQSACPCGFPTSPLEGAGVWIWHCTLYVLLRRWWLSNSYRQHLKPRVRQTWKEMDGISIGIPQGTVEVL